nr:VIT1/CCC1 transporter family protein [Phycisphaera mikurensis]
MRAENSETPTPTPHEQPHRTQRAGWLRAAVLGGNDGVVSVASVVVGVASGGADAETIALAGTAALVAGAVSMAAGEYVSVRSQADLEAAELELERRALVDHPGEELDELAAVYEGRGLRPELAREVAAALTAHDALAAHARDEMGISDALAARPTVAAAASAAAFVAGGVLPLLAAVLTPHDWTFWLVPAATLLTLAGLGGLAGHAGGASVLRGAWRVTFWGAAAMALTAAVGRLFGVG